MNPLCNDSQDYFAAKKRTVILLTPEAAIAVCAEAIAHGLVVARVEGGVWHNPAFEPRGDCIWDGVDPPVDEAIARANNDHAAQFISEETGRHTAFIVTAPPIQGWPHSRLIFTIDPKRVVTDAIVDDLLADANDDYVGLWQVVDGVKRHDQSRSEEQIRASTLEVVRLLLKNGMVAGNLVPGGGFDPWPTQDAMAVINVIEGEWNKMVHSPDIGDICWFDRRDAAPEGPK